MMEERAYDEAFKALSRMESLFAKAARHAEKLDDKLRFQRAAKVYSDALRQHRLNFYESDDAEAVAAKVETCECCGAEK
jgi:gamma-glutamyltranspeptidase